MTNKRLKTELLVYILCPDFGIFLILDVQFSDVYCTLSLQVYWSKHVSWHGHAICTCIGNFVVPLTPWHASASLSAWGQFHKTLDTKFGAVIVKIDAPNTRIRSSNPKSNFHRYFKLDVVFFTEMTHGQDVSTFTWFAHPPPACAQFLIHSESLHCRSE